MGLSPPAGAPGCRAPPGPRRRTPFAPQAPGTRPTGMIPDPGASHFPSGFTFSQTQGEDR